VTTRVIAVLLALVTGAFLIAAPAPALAQHGAPGGAHGAHDGHDHGRAGDPAGAREGLRQAALRAAENRKQPPSTPGKSTSRDDVTQGSGKGMALLFWMFALGCVGGSIFVITRRNLIAAVMGMVATFFAVAALYMMLYAHFLSVVQMLVYAGAIMVLFVFVIMVLNRPEDEPWVGKRALVGKVVALSAMAYLFARMAGVLWSVVPPDPVGAALAPRPVRFHGDVYDWGSTAAVGKELFTDGLFPFEAISILLLIAVVGAIAIARPLKNDETT
jgi:NADH-quinone oxidoreductase subunit J